MTLFFVLVIVLCVLSITADQLRLRNRVVREEIARSMRRNVEERVVDELEEELRALPEFHDWSREEWL